LPLPEGFARNLRSRVLTAVLVLPPLLAAILLGPPWLGAAVIALAAGVGLFEFFGLLMARGIRPMRLTGSVLAAAFFIEAAWPAVLPRPLLPLLAVALLSTTLLRGMDLLESVASAALSLLGALYLGALGGTIAGLRVQDPEASGGWRIAFLLITVMLSDTAAYFVGCTLGRHRLAPRLSPGKTVEGALGGLAGGVAGALLVRALGLPQVPVAHAVGLGILVAVLGIAGDLDESLLKRWAGVKDSGTLFPGHGGMLDRLDSLLFGAPVLYYYFLYIR
jgi:phosphatidate cytidylyltransferase